MVGPLVADGHAPSAEYPCPRRPVLPHARAAGLRRRAGWGSSIERRCVRGSPNSARPSGSDLAPATIHRVVQLLSQCVDAAVEDRLITAQPGRQAPAPEDRAARRCASSPSEELWRLTDCDRRHGIGRSSSSVASVGSASGRCSGCGRSASICCARRVHVAETLVDIEGHIHFGPPKTKAAVRSVPIATFVCRGAVGWSNRPSPPAAVGVPVTERPSRSAPSLFRRSVVDSGRRGGRPRSPAHPRSAAHRRLAVDRRGRPSQARWPCSPATRRCRSCSIVTDTSTRNRTSRSSKRSSSTQPGDDRPGGPLHSVGPGR